MIVKDGSNCTKSRNYINNSDLEYAKFKYINTSDIGIYDAINQAKDYISGTHVWVIGCGDIPHFDTIKKLHLIERRFILHQYYCTMGWINLYIREACPLTSRYNLLYRNLSSNEL